MSPPDKRLDALIHAGWNALEREFQREDVGSWREQAYRCVGMLVGENHPYTEHFKNGMQGAESASLLTDVGVLTATKLWLFQGLESHDATTERDSAETTSDEAIVSLAGPFCYLSKKSFSGSRFCDRGNVVAPHVQSARFRAVHSMTDHRSQGVRGCQQEEILEQAC
jgi:hypothetical protein